jgi:hypothetical protein
MFQELTVDLRCAPENRWHLTPLQCTQARELLALYTADLGLRPDVAQFLTSSVKDLVPRDHLARDGVPFSGDGTSAV